MMRIIVTSIGKYQMLKKWTSYAYNSFYSSSYKLTICLLLVVRIVIDNNKSKPTLNIPYLIFCNNTIGLRTVVYSHNLLTKE